MHDQKDFEETINCPHCGEQIDVEEGVEDFCDDCGWPDMHENDKILVVDHDNDEPWRKMVGEMFKTQKPFRNPHPFNVNDIYGSLNRMEHRDGRAIIEKARQMGSSKYLYDLIEPKSSHTKVRYIGKNPLYYYRTALMSLHHPYKRGKVMLQFDRHDTPNDKAFNWHEFLRKDVEPVHYTEVDKHDRTE